MQVNVPDDPTAFLPDVVDNVFPFLDTAREQEYGTCVLLLPQRKKVLVHCRLGVSRSASIVLAYLLKNSDKSLKEVWKEVREKRPIVKPNPSFIKQLMYLEAKWKGQDTSSIGGPEEVWGEDCMRVMRWTYMHGEEKL